LQLNVNGIENNATVQCPVIAPLPLNVTAPLHETPHR